jgi:hypothetical protein
MRLFVYVVILGVSYLMIRSSENLKTCWSSLRQVSLPYSIARFQIILKLSPCVRSAAIVNTTYRETEGSIFLLCIPVD